MTTKKQSETYIGIDYGEANIGIALGRNGFATPLQIIDGKNPQTAIHTLVRIASENKVNTFVIGLPLNAEGKETEKSLKIRQFSNLLRRMSKRKVEYQNEYGTSKQAALEAYNLDYSQKGRRRIDHISAAIILRQYFQETRLS